jgi:hypothetical protein
MRFSFHGRRKCTNFPVFLVFAPEDGNVYSVSIGPASPDSPGYSEVVVVPRLLNDMVGWPRLLTSVVGVPRLLNRVVGVPRLLKFSTLF